MTRKQKKIANEILEILKNKKILIEDILPIYGYIGLQLGLSISSCSTLPNIEEVEKLFRKENTINTALILSGWNIITTWTENYKKHPKLSILPEEE